jgi:hypothetical protein
MTDHDAGTAEAGVEAPPAEDLKRQDTGEGPGENITQPPASSPPSVNLTLSKPQLTAGVSNPVTLHVYRGTNYILQGGVWVAIPAANFTDLCVTVQGLGEVRDHRSTVNSGGTYPFTFPQAGSYQITGYGNTNDGRVYNAQAITATVVNAPPPSFTWNSPAQNATVDVGPSGGPLTVDITAPEDLAYPLTVQVDLDGMTTSDQAAGTHFSRSRTLAQTPLGSRSITVTVTDAQQRSASQSRSITARDGAPPTVTLDPFPNPLIVQQLPAAFVLTGRTSGAASGVTSVAYSVPALGVSGQAANTGPNGDWSSWSASIPLNTTGTDIAFTVTATDSRGGTGSASSTVTVQF